MIRALVWKELRETAGITAAFLVVAVMYFNQLVGSRLFTWFYAQRTGADWYPFHDFSPIFLFIALGLALALGFRQSAVEPARGTSLYLFHRPIDRSRIMLIKLATGLGLQTLLLSSLIVIYGLWAAKPGHVAAPFEWSMTGPAFRIVVTMTFVYLAAFSSGNYAASWVGARLLPLIAAVVPAVWTLNMPWWWVFGAPVALLVSLWFVSDILLETRTRDY